MNKEAIDYTLISITGLVGVSDVQNTLNIILLVLDCLWLLWKVCYKIYEHFKNKEIDKVADDIKELRDGVEDIADKYKPKDE